MVKVKVLIDNFNGMFDGKFLKCSKNDEIIISDSTWETLNKSFSKFFKFIEKAEEEKSFSPPSNKMIDKTKIKNKTWDY